MAAAKKQMTDEEREREKRRLKKELICHTHDYIEQAAEQIINFDLSQLTIQEIIEAETEIHRLAGRIIELVEYAKERGCAMEDRLQTYSDAIENLGFVRKR